MGIDKREVILGLICAYLVTGIANMLMLSTKAAELVFVSQINVGAMGLTFLVFFLGLIALNRMLNRNWFLYYVMNILVVVFSLQLIWESPRNVYLTLGLMLFVAMVIFFTQHHLKETHPELELTGGASLGILIALAIGVATIIAYSTIMRFKTYNAATFDFGIFAQMYEYMKHTGLPYTTVERNRFLSHFAVHLSPIYYVLLPGYFLISKPEFLLAAQAFIICSAAIPVYFLARHFQLANRTALLLGMAYLFYPGVVAPAFYDFHENKFLPVLILWLCYFYEKQRLKAMVAMIVAVLLVKEDAPLYIMTFGIYVAVARSQKKQGLLIFLGGLTYFIGAVTLLSQFGLGIMDNRFANYQLPGETGLLVVAKNMALNPMFVLNSLFSEEKIRFILYMFSPLMFLPLVTKKWKTLILVAPMLVMNLMTVYPYQYDIGYQYTYGVAAFLFYLTVQNLQQLKANWQKNCAMLMVVLSLAFVITATNNWFTYFHGVNRDFQAELTDTRNTLALIPLTGSVTSDPFFTAHLYKIRTLYEYPGPRDTDFVVIDKRASQEQIDARIQELEQRGYTEYLRGGLAIVYSK